MSTAHIHIPSFNAGEISPLMTSRFGVEKQAAGCRRLRNFIIHPHGPAFRRPGMEYMGAAATNASPSNLRSFQFSASTVFVLELAATGLRVWQNGGLVALQAPVALPYSAEELPQVQMCQVNDVVYLSHPNHAPHKLTRYADDNWQIQPVEWLAPPMLDENPGNQALPDQFALREEYDMTTYLVAPAATLTGYFFGSFDPLSDHVVDVDFVGTPPTGPKRLIITNASGSLVFYDHTWDTAFPSVYPFQVTGAVGNGNYRLIYQGEAWSNGGSPGRVRVRNAVKPTPGSNTKYYDITGMTPARPSATTVLPEGKFKILLRFDYYINADAAGAWVKLEKRTTIGSGPWTEVGHYSLASGVNETVEGHHVVPTEYRYSSNATLPSVGVGQRHFRFYSISLTAPFQTSIAISHTTGTGRTLTANRPLWKPEHVGSLWQLTHRRDEAFVQLNPTSAAVAATAVLTISSTAVAASTVTIGSRVYTWAASVTTAANTVVVGANATASAANLAAAINGGAGSGSTYGSQTAPHADVTAVAASGVLTITARKPGTGAHAIPVTDTMSNASWNDVFLSGGVDANVTIAAMQTAELRVNGKWSIYTYGSWEATLFLERKNAAGNWEFVRSWKSNKDRNLAENGETLGEETLRLRISAGTSLETSTAASPRFILEATDGRIDGVVKITAVTSSVQATCDVLNPVLSTDPTYVWTEGAFSDAQGYPRSVALYENRLWWAGTKQSPMRLWASVTGDIENFRRTSLDDASLSFTPNAGELNPVQWMLPQGTDLLIGTYGDEWTLNGEGKPVTPTNVMLRPQSRFGSAAVAAILASEVVVFVQRGGRRVRRIAPRSANESWSTADMTVLAEHIARAGIRQMAYGSNPNAILWAVTEDGKLLGMTLEVEQNVFGWHVHETDGFIESVAVVYGAEADEVWLSVLRGTARSIERFDPLVFTRDFSQAGRMMYVDCATRYEGPPETIITGLERLEGKQVLALADGIPYDGIVNEGQFSFADAATTIIIGLPFTSELQPERQEVQTQKGSAQGMNWRVSRVSAYVHASQGGEVAEHPNSRFEALPYADGSLFSGDVETALESEARRNVDVIVRTTKPQPLNIGSLTLKLDLYGD